MSRANFIDETNHRYGKLQVIEPVRRPQDRKTMWRCICDCGNEIYCSGSDLRAGKRTSCGKHCSSIIDETNKTYGYLRVLRKDETPALFFADKSIHWICKCQLCGNTKSISGRSLRNGDTKSCGCLKSAGEQTIQEILSSLNYEYKKEYTFEDLISPYSSLKLRFDFAVIKNKQVIFLIEYQGEQHYKEIPYFQHSLDYTQNCDNTKYEYCQHHNIPLLYIKHDNGQVPSEEEILAQIQIFIKKEEIQL